MIIKATAPTRVDLAGGTLDIHPIFVLEGGAVTVNAAIGLTAEVTIETRGDARVEIVAEDIGERAEAGSIDSLQPGGPLDLITRIIAFYKPETGITVRTKSNVPSGSGLGASSSLLIALSHALNELNGNPYTPDDLIHTGANLEAQSIGIPTGKQDYLSATHGGANALWFQLNGIQIEPLGSDSEFFETLESHIVLSFTGASHFSATSNWNMIKAYIDDAGGAKAKMKEIKNTALLMRSILLERRFDEFPRALAREWENRKALAEGVSTPLIEKLMNAAKDAGAAASKICGAGGGGCMITWAPPESRQAVETALAENGAKILPFHIARKGVETTTSEE
ncbi:MAG: hypothetical protein ABIH66_07845 [bacterium]